MVWLFIAEFLFYASGYVVQMTAGRFLGPEDYGRYALVITVTLLVANLIGSGIPMAMSKFLSETRAKNPKALGEVRRKSMRAQMVVTIFVTASFFLLAPVIAALLGDKTLTPWFMVASLIIPCYAADAFYFYLFSGMRIFSVQSALKFVRAFLRIIFISALTYLFHLKGIFIGYLLVPIGVMFVAAIVDKRTRLLNATRTEASAVSGFSYKQLYTLALPITGFLVLFEVLVSFDLYVLKYIFASDAVAGEYNAALTIARIPSFLFFALTLILLPSISELFAKADLERVRVVVSNAFRFMLIVGAPFVAVSWAYPQTLTLIFFGQGYAQAAHLLPLLASSMTILSLLYVMAFAYNGAGKIKTPIAFAVGLIGLNVALDLSLLPTLGAAAVSGIKFVVSLMFFPFLLISLRRAFRLHIAVSDVAKIAIGASVVYVAMWAGTDSATWMFSVAVPLAVGYIAFLWFTGVIQKEDIERIKKNEISKEK